MHAARIQVRLTPLLNSTSLRGLTLRSRRCLVDHRVTISVGCYRIFIALESGSSLLAEQLHFVRAAELLPMTQPALSHQIKALENDLDVRLFDRTKRKVKLTDAGSYFLREAQSTLKQAEPARAVAKRVARGQLGVLRIGYIQSADDNVRRIGRARVTGQSGRKDKSAATTR